MGEQPEQRENATGLMFPGWPPPLSHRFCPGVAIKRYYDDG